MKTIAAILFAIGLFADIGNAAPLQPCHYTRPARTPYDTIAMLPTPCSMPAHPSFDDAALMFAQAYYRDGVVNRGEHANQVNEVGRLLVEWRTTGVEPKAWRAAQQKLTTMVSPQDRK